jgi:hypothetical protein
MARRVSQFNVARLFRDDLPVVWISPTRASGVISADTTSTFIRFGESEFSVGVTHMRFPNGGDWAFFACPACARRARKLWLIDGAPRCRRCCIDRGVRCRTDPMSVHQRAQVRIPDLLARLTGTKPARLHPRGGAMMERRGNFELSLQRCLLTVRRHNLRDVAKLRGK